MMKMSKISNNLISCKCGEEVEKRYYDANLRVVENPETHIIEEWFVWNCTSCGRSYKQLKPESIIIK